jgi:hypothetical protein
MAARMFAADKANVAAVRRNSYLLWERRESRPEEKKTLDMDRHGTSE